MVQNAALFVFLEQIIIFQNLHNLMMIQATKVLVIFLILLAGDYIRNFRKLTLEKIVKYFSHTNDNGHSEVAEFKEASPEI